MFLEKKTREKEREEVLDIAAWLTYPAQETRNTKWKRLFIRDHKLLEKGQRSSSVWRWAVKKRNGGLNETMRGSRYGAHSRGVAGHGRTMQARVRRVPATDMSPTRVVLRLLPSHTEQASFLRTEQNPSQTSPRLTFHIKPGRLGNDSSDIVKPKW